MLRVKDERDVQRILCRLTRLLAIQLQQEVGCVAERLVGTDDALTFANAIEVGDDHRDLRHQTRGLTQVGFVRVFLFVGVVDRKRGDGGAQHVHRLRVFRERLDQPNDVGMNLTRLREFAFVGVELLLSRKLAVDEQVRRLFKGGALGEFVDIDAAIREHSLFTVDPADAGVCRNDTFEPFSRCRRSGGHA